MKRIATMLFAAACAASCPGAENIAPGQWELSSDGEYYSLQSNQAGMRPILDAIREISPADFRIRAFEDRDVSIEAYNIPLEKLLDQLDLSYVLQFERSGESEEFQLSKGWISQSEPASSSVARSPFADPAASSGRDIAADTTIPDDIRRELAAAKPNEEYRAPSPITVKVDGIANDWPAGIPRQFVSHEFVVDGKTPTNDADASFGLAGAADDDYLYLAIDIADDLRAADKATSLPLSVDDTIEIVISAGGNPVSAVINRHHVLTSSQDGDELKAAARQLVSFNNGTKAAIINEGDGWKLEVAVPLDQLGGKNEKVTTLGFNVLLRDADKGEETPSVLSWSNAGTLVPGQAVGNGTLRILKMPQAR